MSGTLDADLPGASGNDHEPPTFRSGGGAGWYFWYELENQSNALDWPDSIPNDTALKLGKTTLDDGLSLLLGAGDCPDPFSLKGYPQPYQNEANKVRNALGITPTDHCVLWANYPSPKQTSPPPVAVTGLSWPLPIWYENVSYIPNNEIHSPNPNSPSGVASPPATVAWNVRIWRQGQSQSFFDRRVGLNVPPNGKDSDPSGTQQLAWWRGGVVSSSCSPTSVPCLDKGVGGVGGIASNDNPKAGPLGALSVSDEADCQNRIKSAPKMIQFDSEKKPTANTAAWVNGRRRDLSKLSPNHYACYWSFPEGATGNNITEAIYLEWSLNQYYFGGGNGIVHFEVVAPPGKMYAILINAISNREALLIPPASNLSQLDPMAQALARYHNYFHVYTPNATPVSPGNPPTPKPKPKPKPPTTSYETFDEPTLQMRVDADASVPVRTQSLVTVQAIENDPTNETQAIFGRQVQLLHFSPQTSVDGATSAASYPDGYIRYDSDTNPPERIPSQWYSGPTGQPVQLALLPQPAIPGDDAGVVSSNEFRMTWLKPTVQNPCPAWGWAQQTTNPWPYEPDKCGISANNVITGSDAANPPPLSQLPRNAWSDSVSARILYEARWVSRRPVSDDNTWDPQWQSNFPLRCNGDNSRLDKTVSVTSSACDQVFPLTYFNYAHPSSQSSGVTGDQWADGYVNVVDEGDGDGLGAVGVRLRTNAPSKVSDSVLFHRDGSTDWAAGDPLDRQSPLINTKSGQPELWYCKPGLPAGANLVTGASAYKTGAPVPVPADQENDQACGGYTVKWNWDWQDGWAPIQPDGSQNQQATNCDTLLPAAPGRTSFAVPTFSALQQHDPSGASYVQNVGQYSMYDGSNPVAGDPNWKTLLTAGSYEWTIPYNGARPGNPSVDGSAYVSKACYRVIVHGRHQPKNSTNTGVRGWVHTGDTSHSWDETKPDTYQTATASTRDSLPDICIPSTISSKTSTTTTGTGKNKKKTSTTTWSCTYPVHHVDHHTVIDPVYTFEFNSADCHPQTDAQASVLTPAMKNALVSDDKVLNVTPSDVQSAFTNGEDALKAQPGVDYSDRTQKHPEFDSSWSDDLGDCNSPQIHGFVTKGGWDLDRAHNLQVLDSYNNDKVVGTYSIVGDGWGVNQSGPRVDPGQYQTRFTFSGITANDLSSSGSIPGLGSCGDGICWALNADYSGNAGWEWSSVTHFTQPWTMQNTDYIDVYGFRASR